MRNVVSLDDFLGRFSSHCRNRDRDEETRPFALILGAGASRSAGIPLASEMIHALELLAEASGHKIAKQSGEESRWSSVFRQVMSFLPRDRTPADYAREFVVECISRAEGEANTTHLLAAALTNGGLFTYLATTNFDDQALAGFWSQPRGIKNSRYKEPHVIYDASTPGLGPKIGRKVPIILKAHGHHTTYGLGIVDDDVQSLAPHVHESMRHLPAPSHGFIVVGYSGFWNDGIMRAFADKAFMAGKTVYWFHTGKQPPHTPCIDACTRVADMRFVRIADSDDLFLKLWQSVEARNHDENDDRETLLDPADLFTFSTSFKRWAPRGLVSAQGWWYPANEWPRSKFTEMKRRLLPRLMMSEQDDEGSILSECMPYSLKTNIAYNNLGSRRALLPHLEWLDLYKIMPLGIPWTRRNRKLALLAFSSRCDKWIRSVILHGLSEWGYDPRTF
jgi:hypothetical protein